MKNLVIILLFVSIIACNTNTQKAKETNQKIDLVGTKWIYKPFAEVPNCVDTLIFNTNQAGSDYSCEHEMFDSLTYEVSNDTIRICRFGFSSEVDLNSNQIIVSKFELLIIDNQLKTIDIKHKEGNKFESVSKKFIEGRVYKKVE